MNQPRERRISERVALLCAIVLTLGTLLAACSAGQDGGLLEAQVNEPLIVWHGYGDDVAGALVEAARLRDLDVEFVRFDGAELEEHLLEALDGGLGPGIVIGPDVCVQLWCSEHVQKVAEKIREAFAERIPPQLFYPSAWCDPRFCDPSPYAVPIGWDYLGVFADPGQLEALQLETPSTAEEVEELVVGKSFGVGWVGYTPNPEDPYPWPRWPLPWPPPYSPWPEFLEGDPDVISPVMIGHSSQVVAALVGPTPVPANAFGALRNVHRVYVTDEADLETATAFIDSLLSTEVQRDLFERAGMLPATAEALERLAEDVPREVIDYGLGEPNPQPNLGGPSPDPMAF